MSLKGGYLGNFDGQGQEARFSYPTGVCLNPKDGCLYVADNCNNSIRKVTLQGEAMTLVAAHGLNLPQDIVMHYEQDVFFVTNANNIISKVTTDGKVSLFAGNLLPQRKDGIGAESSFFRPFGITIDQKTGTLYVCETEGHAIRKISSQGEVTTIAGSTEGYADGNGTNAKFNCPFALCFDPHTEALLVCDYNNNRIRRVESNGNVSTLCEIQMPTGVAIANKNSFFVSSSIRIYLVTINGQNCGVQVFAGGATNERVDGRAEECGFGITCLGIAVMESMQVCYVCDQGSHAIRKIDYVSTE